MMIYLPLMEVYGAQTAGCCLNSPTARQNLFIFSTLLNPSVAGDAQPGTFPTPAGNLEAPFPPNRTREGGRRSLLQPHLLLPPLSPHPAPGLLPCLGRRWNLHARPLPVSLAPYLAASPWPSASFDWGTPLLLFFGPFPTPISVLPSPGCTLRLPRPLSLVPGLDLLGGRRHQH